MKIFAIAAAFVAALAGPAIAAEILGTVTGVIDGDTFNMRNQSGLSVRVRFCGIDAPERGMPGYHASKMMLARMIEAKTVRCVPVGEGTPCDGRSKATNRDRVVAQCFLENVDIATEMTRAGWACDWPKFSGGRYKVTAATCSRD